MVWRPKNRKPDYSGWFYVRTFNSQHTSIRYYDNSTDIWWNVTRRDGWTPNAYFSEWLEIVGINQFYDPTAA
jgi:hypothetical protein